MKFFIVTKLLLGGFLILLGIMGALYAYSYLFNWNWVRDGYEMFGRGDDGGASMAPIMFGLIAISGSLIISSIKESELRFICSK